MHVSTRGWFLAGMKHVIPRLTVIMHIVTEVNVMFVFQTSDW
jgi:hypothetical protein